MKRVEKAALPYMNTDSDSDSDGDTKKPIEVVRGLKPDQKLVAIVRQELVSLMGGKQKGDSDSNSDNDTITILQRLTQERQLINESATIAAATQAANNNNATTKNIDSDSDSDSDTPSIAVILLAGLQGVGKTTMCGKLALKIKSLNTQYDDTKTRDKNNKKTTTHKKPKKDESDSDSDNDSDSDMFRPLLVAADVYRPAAVQQLQQLGKKINVPVYCETDSDDDNDSDTNTNAVINVKPEELVKNALQYAIDSHSDSDSDTRGYNVVIIDTAGRLTVDETMMQELKNVKQAVLDFGTPPPSDSDRDGLNVQLEDVLLVVDAMTGQAAAQLVDTFNTQVVSLPLSLSLLLLSYAFLLTSLSLLSSLLLIISLSLSLSLSSFSVVLLAPY